MLRTTLFRTTAFALLAAAAATASGCAAPTSAEVDGTESSSALTTGEKTAYEFFVAKGLKNYQAAGIIGNLIQESNVNPDSEQYGGPGRGIAQWSEGGRWNADGRDNAVWFAGSRGESVYALETQLEFVWYELTTFGGYGLSELRASSNVSQATIAFQDRFEGCGDCRESQRIAYAQEVLTEYGKETGSTPPSTPTAVPTRPSGCTTIKPGEGLKAGESFKSCSGEFSLDMQTDGNLVVYRSERSGSVARWSSGTAKSDGYVAVMQKDGNFVLYGRHSNPLWSSTTEGHSNVSELAVQDDGNLVVYAGSHPLWASNTAENEIGR
jgi:hypothetical protein